MASPSNEEVDKLIEKHKETFSSNKTKNLDFREEQLQKIIDLLTQNFESIRDALYQDYKKPKFEIELEINYCIGRARYIKSKLRYWASGVDVPIDIYTPTSKMSCYPEPLGVTLIISPWNYPLILLLEPFCGAIAAGNTAILKPSPFVPNLNNVLKNLIETHLDKDCFSVLFGEKEVVDYLLTHRFDLVFYTGSTHVGRQIYMKAAEKLSPVVLELGGKCPCYVHEDVDIDKTAMRIAHGSTINSGQVCVDVDYILCSSKVIDALCERIKFHLIKMFSENPEESEYYGRIINQGHTKRIASLMESSVKFLYYGGKSNIGDCYIEPSIYKFPDSSTIFNDEVFGPLIPVHQVESYHDAINTINQREKPLAIYLMAQNNDVVHDFRMKTSSGCLSINRIYNQMSSLELPFGGVGHSGIGKYHGIETFKAFSHYKSIYAVKLGNPIIENSIVPPVSNFNMKLSSTALRRNFMGCNIV